MKKVAVVTGGNKGVGFGTVRGLAKKFEGDVFLTSRDEGRGQEALNILTKQEGLSVKYHQCDISNPSSVEKLRDYMKENYGGIDVLVNNAAMAFKRDATDPMLIQATQTLKVNYWDTKKTSEILFPILKPGARVVNVSSSAGFLGRIPGEGLKKKFASESITFEELDNLMIQYVEDVKEEKHTESGWPPSSNYVVSKVGLSCLSRIQQRESDKKYPDADIVINHVHPGYVDTDMTSHKGPLSIDEGAKSSIFTALLPPGTTDKGKYFWANCQEVDWVNGPLPASV